jgi:hypothetical protein
MESAKRKKENETSLPKCGRDADFICDDVVRINIDN